MGQGVAHHEALSLERLVPHVTDDICDGMVRMHARAHVRVCQMRAHVRGCQMRVVARSFVSVSAVTITNRHMSTCRNGTHPQQPLSECHHFLRGTHLGPALLSARDSRTLNQYQLTLPHNAPPFQTSRLVFLHRIHPSLAATPSIPIPIGGISPAAMTSPHPYRDPIQSTHTYQGLVHFAACGFLGHSPTPQAA